MKIVYISDSNIPSRSANSIHVMKMCQAFSKSGHEVILFAPNIPDSEPGVNDPYEFYGVNRIFIIEKLPWVMFKGRGYIYGFLAALRARQFQPDLVYGRSLSGCMFSGLLNLPFVYESHFPEEGRGKMSGWMFSSLLRNEHMKSLVVISHALRCYYQQRYRIPDDRIKVEHDGADEPCDFSPSEIANSSRLQVGYIGHLYRGRGIEIISVLAKSCSWADFHVIGGSESDVKHWKNRLKEVNNVLFYGFMPPSQTDKYRQLCDVLLAPYQRNVSVQKAGSDTSRWMSPIKIFEYMASGSAIVCSDLPVLREVLVHDKTGLLCEPENPGSWIASLERLRDDKRLIKRLGEAAREEFIARYTWMARARGVLAGISG